MQISFVLSLLSRCFFFGRFTSPRHLTNGDDVLCCCPFHYQTALTWIRFSKETVCVSFDFRLNWSSRIFPDWCFFWHRPSRQFKKVALARAIETQLDRVSATSLVSLVWCWFRTKPDACCSLVDSLTCVNNHRATGRWSPSKVKPSRDSTWCQVNLGCPCGSRRGCDSLVVHSGSNPISPFLSLDRPCINVV